MHRARLRPDHQEDHGDHPNLVRQDHGHQGHRGDQTEAHPQQAVCPAQPELPTAPVLLQEALPRGESQPLAASPVLEPVSAQQQVPDARQAELLQAVSPAPRLVALQARDVRLPAALHRVHGAQDVLRRARAVRDAQRAALALTELQAQRWALEVRRAGPEARREPAAELGAAAERPQVVGVAAVPGAEVQPQAAAQQEVSEARDAQQGEPVAAAAPQGVRPAAQRQEAQQLAEPWVVLSGEPWAHLQAQQVRPARARSAHRHSTHKQRSLRYAQRRASSWPVIRDEVLS
ncbi:hypothetical protein [Tardiphaga sp. 841_E9_N1_2]|uniref:hypothetical protein n=1 Tax=Tardiphaga sp. 841_E9_N1_2 TaxID=3240762 RepID=UPI003F2565C9